MVVNNCRRTLLSTVVSNVIRQLFTTKKSHFPARTTGVFRGFLKKPSKKTSKSIQNDGKYVFVKKIFFAESEFCVKLNIHTENAILVKMYGFD